MPAPVAEEAVTIRIQLREPKWVDQLALLLGALVMIYGVVALVDATDEATRQGARAFSLLGLSIAAFGYRGLHIGSCDLELADRGIVLRCYSLSPFSLYTPRGHYCAGLIPWVNLVEVGITTAQMVQCLGLRLRDPRAFLNSRDQLTYEPEYMASNRLLVKKFNRFSRDLLGTLVGNTKLPRPNDELAILEWNRENYGYHIVCPGRPWWFFGRPYKGGPTRIAEVIRQQAEIHR